MSSTPLSIQVGPATVTYFSLILIGSILVTGCFALFRASRFGLDTGSMFDSLLWIIIGSVIGARIFYIFNPPPSASLFYTRDWYLTHPLDFQVGPLAIWSGGLGVAGAIVGGILTAAWCLTRSWDLRWKWADALAPALLLGLAMIPWANIANQQLYGPPTNLPWGIPIHDPISPYFAGTRFQPTSAYVSIWTSLCLAIILVIERTSEHPVGFVFLGSLGAYLIGLFLADWLRLDVNHGLWRLTGTQWLTLLIVPLCVIQLFRLRFFPLSRIVSHGASK